MTSQERAKLAVDTISAFGWEISWRSDKPIPDDAWPIDIIAKAISAAANDAAIWAMDNPPNPGKRDFS